VEKKPTCFLIDDDIDDQEVFEMALQKIDGSIRFLYASDGAEGLQKLRENPSFTPDFIFLDINMPKMNGIDCLPEIKKLPHLRNARIIMYSTTANEAIKRKTRQLGADEFLVKPTKLGMLVNDLSRILEKRSA
jgi:CheY-like chemotaxis protein